MMVAYVAQRKESFTGDLDLLKLDPNPIPYSRRGVSILIQKVFIVEVFNYFGMHSLFDTVAKLSFYLMILSNAPGTQ
jgi:hypothetical protein